MAITINVFLSMLIMFIFFYPIGYLSKFIYGLSHKFLIFLIIYIHIISTGGLYLKKEIYSDIGWTAVKDFNFSFLSLVKSYYPLIVFMLIFLLFIIFFNFIIKIFHKRIDLLNKKKISELINLVQNEIFELRKKNQYSSILIFVIGLLQISASLIMLHTGKGMVGIVSDGTLPFKIIGISYLLSKMIAPLLIAILFIKYKTSRTIFIYILFVALVSGAAQLSKSTFFLTIIVPILIIMFSRKNYFLKIFLGLFILYGLHHIESARILIYFNRDELGMMDITPHIYEWYILFFKSLFNIVTLHFWENSLYSILGIVDRISSTQGIILGTQFDLELIGGAFEQFKGIVFHKLQIIDGDAYNMAWMGVTLPPGYAFGGDLLSTVTAFWFHGKTVFLASAIYLAMWCKIIDFVCNKILISGDLGCILFNFLYTTVLLIWIGANAFFYYFFILFLFFFINFALRSYKIKN